MNNTSLYTAQSALAQLPRQGSWLWKQAKRASSESGTDPEARGPVWNTASIWGGPCRARPGQRSVTGLWGMAPSAPQPLCHRFWGLTTTTWLPLSTLTCVGARGARALWTSTGDTQAHPQGAHVLGVYREGTLPRKGGVTVSAARLSF